MLGLVPFRAIAEENYIMVFYYATYTHEASRKNYEQRTYEEEYTLVTMSNLKLIYSYFDL